MRPKKGFIQVAYNNVQSSDTYTHTILETCKNAEIVFIAELNIFDFSHTSSGTATQPSFHRLITNLQRDSKLLVFVNQQIGSYVKFNQNDACTQVSVGFIIFINLYTSPQPSLARLRGLLAPLNTRPRTCILRDFNRYHNSWGNKTNLNTPHNTNHPPLARPTKILRRSSTRTTNAKEDRYTASNGGTRTSTHNFTNAANASTHKTSKP